MIKLIREGYEAGDFPVKVIADWNIVLDQIKKELENKFGKTIISDVDISVDNNAANFTISCNGIACSFISRCWVSSNGYGMIMVTPIRSSYSGNARNIPYDTYSAMNAKNLVKKISYIFEN